MVDNHIENLKLVCWLCGGGREEKLKPVAWKQNRNRPAFLGKRKL